MTSSRSVLADLGLTAGVMAALSIIVTVATEPKSRPVDAGAYALSGLVALPILVRRRRPLGALLASALLLLIYYASNYPGFSPVFALPVQLYSASRAGRWRWAAGITAFFLTAGYIVTIGIKHVRPLQTLSDSLPQAALMATIILFGEYVRSRHRLTAETRERLRQAEESRERETARRIAEERLRIARELHDTVAHSMATITVQAGSALHRLGDRDDGSRAALTAIRATGRRALADIRTTLGLLRDGGAAEPVPEHGVDRLPVLLDADPRGRPAGRGRPHRRRGSAARRGRPRRVPHPAGVPDQRAAARRRVGGRSRDAGVRRRPVRSRRRRRRYGSGTRNRARQRPDRHARAGRGHGRHVRRRPRAGRRLRGHREPALPAIPARPRHRPGSGDGARRTVPAGRRRGIGDGGRARRAACTRRRRRRHPAGRTVLAGRRRPGGNDGGGGSPAVPGDPGRADR